METRILLAEDSASAAAFTAKILRDEGHAVDIVADGRAALAAIEAAPFDLVLTDWLMPEMDGLELCHEIRRRPETAELYVVFLTTEGGTEQIVEGLSAGADDYLVKPFHAAELLARVRAGLRIVALRAERERLHEESLARLHEAGRLKDEFVALVSHELRTPLTSIQGYIELLREDETASLTDEQLHCLDVIERNGARLLHLIDDLLLVGRIQAGQFELARTDLRLDSLVHDCVDASRPIASGGDVELRVVSAAATVLADRARLAQAFDNLIRNAIKFTPAGGTVSVDVQTAPDRVTVRVVDTGVGIPATELDRLFERFFRASTAKSIAGTGLGLYVTRAIVESHDGSIAVESREGEGTTFTVVLPTVS